MFEVYWGPRGASVAEGDLVFVDLLRLSTTLVVMFAQGVEEVFVASTPEEALRIQRERGADWLFGERGGMRIKGFNFGNSPTEVLSVDLRGSRAVITTSNGTPTLLALRRPAVIGALVNASAVVSFLSGARRPAFVLAGDRGSPCEEDLAAAEYLFARASGREVDYDSVAGRILSSRHARELMEMGMVEDVQFALSLDLFPHLPYYDPETRSVRPGPPS